MRTLEERQILSELYKSNMPIRQISIRLNISRPTIYTELKSGATGKTDINGRAEYSPHIAQNNYEIKMANSKRHLPKSKKTKTD